MQNQNLNDIITEDLEKIKNKTTVAKIKDNKDKTIHRREDCYTPGYKEQIKLEDLENYWNDRWDSYNNKWNNERQNYKYFYDSFRLFYYSFYQLQENKKKFYEIGGVSTQMSNKDCNVIDQLIGVNLFGMYVNGKKCIDLTKELDLLKILDNNEKKFTKKFSTTRNWVFEHNFNLYDKKTECKLVRVFYRFINYIKKLFKMHKKGKRLCLSLEPLIWSMRSGSNCLEVNVHGKNSENKFQLIFFYEDDYFQLELILKKIIKSFK